MFSSFRDWSIAWRLRCSYIVLILMTGSASFIALIAMNDVGNQRDQLISHDWALAQASNSINLLLHETLGRSALALVDRDTWRRERTFSDIALLQKKIDTAMLHLEEQDNNQQASPLINALRKKRIAYDDAFEAISNALGDRDYMLAEAEFERRLLPLTEDVMNLVKQLDTLHQQQALINSAQARQDISVASVNLSVVAIISLLVGIFFALTVNRITRPLLEATRIAKRVSDGDLDAALELKVTTRDETGALLLALKEMSSSLKKKQVLRQIAVSAHESNKLKSAFLANMSHEIRTPMNAIIGMTHLTLETDLTSKQKNYIQKAHTAAINLLHLINDILDFSKIEANKLTLDNVDFALEDVLSQVVTLNSLAAQRKGLDFCILITPNTPLHLHGDPLRLTQVLSNLVNNAIKFTNYGEVFLRVSVEKNMPQQLQFSVIDTGIGLDEPQQSQLFQIFSQVDSTIARKYGGSGLGLAISQRLAQLMGGHIDVSSKLGEGSNFCFKVKFGVAQIFPPAVLLPELNNLNVLLAHPHPRSRQIIADMLAQSGCQVTAVANSAEIIDVLHHAKHYSLPFDVVFIDQRIISPANGAPYYFGVNEQDFVPIIVELSSHIDAPMTTTQQYELMQPVLPGALRGMLNNLFCISHQTSVQANHGQLRRYDGVNILLVEDDLVNQELVHDILSPRGIHLSLASDGAKAITMLHEGNYDLVLMDCQMPILDGYQTATQIRTQRRFSKLPIIAMTASATIDEQDKCLSCGMNGFLPKPIDVRHLFEVINHWLPSEHIMLDEAEPAVLELDEALVRLNGDRALLQKLLLRFVLEQTTAVDQITASLKVDNNELALRQVHTLRGLAGNIGAKQVALAASKVETIIKSKEDYNFHLDLLEKQMRQLITVINLSLRDETDNSFVKSPIQTELDVPDHCKTLYDMLIRHSPLAIDQVELVAAYLSARCQSDAGVMLTTLVQKYDFGGAGALMQKLDLVDANIF